jgi:hypothetical protein
MRIDRWNFATTEYEFVHRCLHVPDQAMIRDQVLQKSVGPPDSAAVKYFIRFHLSTSHGKIKDQPAIDFLTTLVEWFFARCIRIAKTPMVDEDGTDVYELSVVRMGVTCSYFLLSVAAKHFE